MGSIPSPIQPGTTRVHAVETLLKPVESPQSLRAEASQVPKRCKSSLEVLETNTSRSKTPRKRKTQTQPPKKTFNNMARLKQTKWYCSGIAKLEVANHPIAFKQFDRWENEAKTSSLPSTLHPNHIHLDGKPEMSCIKSCNNTSCWLSHPNENIA